MEITIQAVDKVMEETGLDYKETKALLYTADGDPDKAISMVRPDIPEGKVRVDEIVGKIKKKVNEGNADRIQISKSAEILVSIQVNVGIVGGLVGLAAAPWAFIAGTVASLGLGCRFEVIRKDGSREEV